MPSELQLEQWSVDRLIDYARNPRRNDHAVEQMAAVITEFGFRIPVVARSSGEIVDGHLRLKAAHRLGLTTVPVVLADELTEAQIRAFRLLANRSATWAEWDDALLALELEDLKLAEFDLALTGFDATGIEALLTNEQPTPDGEQGDGDHPDAADDVPEVPAKPVSRTGDVWAVGQHRLICGDAADTGVVTTLMAGEQAHLLFTSPPYANQRAYTTGGIADWDRLMQGIFAAALLVMAAAAQMLVNLGLVHRDGTVVRYWDDWLTWMPRQDWRFFGWYVWDQDVTVPGDWAGRLAPRHEFLFHFNREATWAEWDEDLLRLELEELKLDDFELALTGFDADQLLEIMAGEETTTEGQTDDDAVPEAPETPVSQLGDVWICGKHRVLCGDATLAESYGRLLGSERVSMVFQDPPYSVNYANSAKDKLRGKNRPILNNNLGEDFGPFLIAALTPALARCDGAVYIAMSSSELDTLQSAFRTADGHWSTFIIWAKNTFTMGHADYQRQYEPMLYGWREGSKRHWCGDRDQGDVWQIKKPVKNGLHP